MDITKFVVSGRDQALLYGDYSTYRAQLSHRLLSIRKKLGQATKKGTKYSKKAPVTSQDIGNDTEYVHLQLSTAERAWAHAMYMKSAHTTDTKGITGATRSHIISRLHKASTIAENLLEALGDRSITNAADTDILELRAYAASLKGAEEFEKQRWESCVRNYSVAWIVYSSLASSSKSDTFKELLSSTIEPSIRYGAYQMRIPRTVAIPVIARRYFPKDDPELSSAVDKLDNTILKDSKVKAETVDTDAASRTISWRSRAVELEDASIAVALASVASAEKSLSNALAETLDAHPKERAAAYDDILIASQDVVDATKHAIDELAAEGVGQGDKRMQGLQITKTAVSYDLISWRIGRNRVLTGELDGASSDKVSISKPRPSKRSKREAIAKEESSGRKLAQLRDRVVMYRSTLQSIDAIRELPGVAADTAFLRELDAKYYYFQALKCLAIARSYDVVLEYKNALALLVRASEISSKAFPILESLSESTADSPPNLSVSLSEANAIAKILQGELQRHRALVELSNIKENTLQTGSMSAPGPPLVERLNIYPADGVNMTNLVTYPPRLDPIPVKPLFFDAAWNYIQYPGHTVILKEESTEQSEASTDRVPDQTAQQKKGWFGFGR